MACAQGLCSGPLPRSRGSNAWITPALRGGPDRASATALAENWDPATTTCGGTWRFTTTAFPGSAKGFCKRASVMRENRPRKHSLDKQTVKVGSPWRPPTGGPGAGATGAFNFYLTRPALAGAHRNGPRVGDLRRNLLRPRRTKRMPTDTNCSQGVRPGPGPSPTSPSHLTPPGSPGKKPRRNNYDAPREGPGRLGHPSIKNTKAAKRNILVAEPKT